MSPPAVPHITFASQQAVDAEMERLATAVLYLLRTEQQEYRKGLSSPNLFKDTGRLLNSSVPCASLRSRFRRWKEREPEKWRVMDLGATEDPNFFDDLVNICIGWRGWVCSVNVSLLFQIVSIAVRVEEKMEEAGEEGRGDPMEEVPASRMLQTQPPIPPTPLLSSPSPNPLSSQLHLPLYLGFRFYPGSTW